MSGASSSSGSTSRWIRDTNYQASGDFQAQVDDDSRPASCWLQQSQQVDLDSAVKFPWRAGAVHPAGVRACAQGFGVR